MTFDFKINLGEIRKPGTKEPIVSNCHIHISTNMTHEEMKLQFDKLPSFVHNNIKLMSFMGQLSKDQAK